MVNFGHLTIIALVDTQGRNRWKWWYYLKGLSQAETRRQAETGGGKAETDGPRGDDVVFGFVPLLVLGS